MHTEDYVHTQTTLVHTQAKHQKSCFFPSSQNFNCLCTPLRYTSLEASWHGGAAPLGGMDGDVVYG